MKSASLLQSGLLSVFIMGLAGFLHAQQLAFPSAEGYGKFTKGGTGGKVVIVKSPGDFPAAVKSSGPKTVIVRCDGNVSSPGSIPSGTTIIGQTAPGDGICLTGGIGVSSNVILRYIRVRGGGDNIGGKDKSDIILDHVSTSWSKDESVSIYHCKNLTIQWTLIAEPFGPDHGFGGIWGGPDNTYHHNMFAHNQSRAPRFSGGIGNNDYRNNVCYNWERNSLYGGEAKQRGGGYEGWSKINVVANYYKWGPAALYEPVKSRIADVCWDLGGKGKFYIAENYVDGYPEVTADNWDGGEFGGAQCIGQDNRPGNPPVIKDDRTMKLTEPTEFMPIKQDTPEIAYLKVLKHVGCSFPNRDELDKKIIEEARTRTAPRGKNGIVSNKSQTGYGTLKKGTPPKDSDNDGMPDDYETKNGLNPNDASDATKTRPDGFTNLVWYCESLVAPTFVLDPAEVIPQDKPKAAFQDQLKLSHSYANHFNSSTTIIKYALPAKSKVKLEVLDVAGKIVATLVDKVKEPGNYSVNLESPRLNTGLYMVKLSAVDQSVTRKLFFIN